MQQQIGRPQRTHRRTEGRKKGREQGQQETYLEQGIQPSIEVGVLQPVLGDQGKDAIQGQHAHQPPLAQAAGQEV